MVTHNIYPTIATHNPDGHPQYCSHGFIQKYGHISFMEKRYWSRVGILLETD